MGRKTESIKKLIIALVLLIITINVQAEAIDLSSSCALNAQSIENQEKPNPVKNAPIVVDKKSTTKKTSSKSNKFGILKLLIPGTLR